MTLKRSKSLPGVAGAVDPPKNGDAAWRGEDNSHDPSIGVPRDSGVGVGSSDNPSFMSDPRSSLVGDLASGGIVSELPSAEACENKGPSPEDESKQPTIGRHYYPEGGWGWLVLIASMCVNVLSHGLHLAGGTFLTCVGENFSEATPLSRGVLGAVSTAVALLMSPITISVCRKKSTRLTAVLGGLVTALGCLFTSFASQYHQLFFSYGTVIGIGVGLTRDSSTLMVGQYFKRRREAVEVLVVGGSGLGISAMSAFIRGAINSFGWRLGLQAVTGVVFLTFVMGTFYRSASLYHPQRRAILHLKNQKRKVKEKSRQDDHNPFFDVTTLRSRTIQILLLSTSLSSFGITTPILYMAQQAEEAGLEQNSVMMLQTYLGLGWFCGCATFGFLTVHRSTECRVGLQYLCQAAMFLCGVTCLAFTAVEGYPGYVLFSWLYGIFCGGFHYALKMFTYEKVRARNFARTWGFVQCSQALPTALGVPITGYINIQYGNKAGYYFSSTFIIFGSMTIFLIDIHRRRAARHQHKHKSGRQHTCQRRGCPESRSRRDSLAAFNIEPPAHTPSLASLIHHPRNINGLPETLDPRNKAELTCISEEGIADMDLPDHLLEELDYLGDCITSCDKVENFLMRSEYENNLIMRGGGDNASSAGYNERRFSRIRRSLSIKTANSFQASNGNEPATTLMLEEAPAPTAAPGGSGASELPSSSSLEVNNHNKFTPSRHITVIEEASV
ncbi:Major facilitator superfamily [Trinorchestia longiramus]|nr:Major facilitator superfamily [Trinorchestia longiramus]